MATVTSYTYQYLQALQQIMVLKSGADMEGNLSFWDGPRIIGGSTTTSENPLLEIKSNNLTAGYISNRLDGMTVRSTAGHALNLLNGDDMGVIINTDDSIALNNDALLIDGSGVSTFGSEPMIGSQSLTDFIKTTDFVIEIGDAVNLNTLTTTGYYIQSQSAQAQTGTNYPVGEAGLLEVISNFDKSEIWQRYTNYKQASFVIYERTYYGTGGGWGSWYAIGGPGIMGATPWVVTGLTIGTITGWAINSYSLKKVNGFVSGSVIVTRTGAALTASGSANLSDEVGIAKMPVGWRSGNPNDTSAPAFVTGYSPLGVRLKGTATAPGFIDLVSGSFPGQVIAQNDQVTISINYWAES